MLAQVIPIRRPETLSGSREDWKVPVFKRLNAWLDGMERRDSMDKLIDITSTLLDGRDELLGELVLAVIRKRYMGLIEQKTCLCPHCKRSLKVRDRHWRRVKTLAGSFALERPYFYCEKCGIGFYPLDEALGPETGRYGRSGCMVGDGASIRDGERGV